jgi:DNA-nicking Smr family endonuclease
LTRELTAQELELWRAVTASVRPRLPRRPAPAPKQTQKAATIPPPARTHLDSPERPNADRAVHRLESAAKPLVTIDRRLKRELTKGRLEIDARLDLHGYRAADAHRRVVAVLNVAQRNGARLALIVTGKGGRPPAGDGGGWGETDIGVLKRQTPLWLADPKLRHIVAGFSEAGQPHGGAGALYVRLRRR